MSTIYVHFAIRSIIEWMGYMHSLAEDLKTENKENAKGISEYGDKIDALENRMEHLEELRPPKNILIIN